jgi:hypothetical protein
MSSNDIRNRVTAISKKLPDQAQDEYYATPEARIDTIFGENQDIYRRLMKVKQEWDQRWKSGTKDMSFPEYLREVYGIEMTMQPEGIDLRYRILDEQKHTIFLLKFGT